LDNLKRKRVERAWSYYMCANSSAWSSDAAFNALIPTDENQVKLHN